MSRLLRLALEDAAPEVDGKPTIVMQGPLCEVFRKALDIAYAKKDTLTGEPVIGQQDNIATESAALQLAAETMANDALMLAHLSRIQDAEPEEQSSPNEPVLNVYGVSLGKISDDTVVDVTKRLAKLPPGRDFFLVVDATGAGPDSEVANAGEIKFMALEQMVKSHGGKTFKDFKQLREHIEQTMPTGGVRKDLGNAALAVVTAPIQAIGAALSA